MDPDTRAVSCYLDASLAAAWGVVRCRIARAVAQRLQPLRLLLAHHLMALATPCVHLTRKCSRAPKGASTSKATGENILSSLRLCASARDLSVHMTPCSSWIHLSPHKKRVAAAAASSKVSTIRVAQRVIMRFSCSPKSSIAKPS